MVLAPEPMAPIPSLMDNLGGQVLDTATALAPVVVPFVLAMTAIGWVLRKFGLSGVVAWNRALGDTGALDPAAEFRKRAAHVKRVSDDPSQEDDPHERAARRAENARRRGDSNWNDFGRHNY